MANKLEGTTEVKHLNVSGNANYGDGQVTNFNFSSLAVDRLGAAKAVHQRNLVWHTATVTTTVVDVTALMYLAAHAGNVVGVSIRNETAPTGGDLTYTVDIQKDADGVGTPVTILSGAITPPVSNTASTGVVTDAPYNALDTFLLVVDATGTTGTNGLGLIVTLEIEESPS